MRAGSARVHRETESTPFVSALMEGRVGRAGYGYYLLRLRHVYADLERHLREHAGHPAVAAVWDPALERLRAIDADLGHWLPERPSLRSAAVTAYRERLAHAARRPHLLVAHHYTRYLGDLAGGQVIGSALSRHHGVRDRGLAFYDFAHLGSPVHYRRRYRERLDRLPLDDARRDEVVEEVVAAFELNRRLLRELGDELLPST
ncbi:MAG: biliverdin-producing heme oxygenase [Nocardioidaceae bacterium]|nr:biliverdin-producing heme oxygenase [Nocardioidaceae bacterium]